MFESTGCNGCHSVSANGSRLISQVIPGTANAYRARAEHAGESAGDGDQYTRRVRRAVSGWLGVPRDVDGDRRRAHDVGVDGWDIFGGSTDAALYKTDDGSVITGTGIPGGSLMPMFSPDGSKLAVNDYAHQRSARACADGLRPGDQHREQLSPCCSWTPTCVRAGRSFCRTTAASCSRAPTARTSPAKASASSGITTGPSSDISIVDVASGTVTLLAQAMGYATPDDAKAGTTYLPFGAEELHHNYFPTVSPVAAGGYFWLFFDSWRHYGNLGLQRRCGPLRSTSPPDGTYAVDRSHPPFYLPGQEFGTGNHRAFAALDPCKMDSDSCTSGTDCCGGYCYVANARRRVRAKPSAAAPLTRRSARAPTSAARAAPIAARRPTGDARTCASPASAPCCNRRADRDASGCRVRLASQLATHRYGFVVAAGGSSTSTGTGSDFTSFSECVRLSAGCDSGLRMINVACHSLALSRMAVT